MRSVKNPQRIYIAEWKVMQIKGTYYQVCQILLGSYLILAISTQPSFGEFRGVWADALHAGFKSTTEIDQMVQRAVDGNYNAIVAEVLAFHDSGPNWHGAYWNSTIVPKAVDITGEIDPLDYLCQQAHAQNIEVHAWLVPFRVSSTWPPSGNTILTNNSKWLMVPQADEGTIAKVGSYYTLDPGSPDVQEYLVSIVRELVTFYDIDGINWDYIRYTQTDAGYPSDTNYQNSTKKRYQRLGGYTWDDFRRRTISELVSRCRAEIPSIKSNPRQPLRHTADLFATGNAPADFTGSQAYTYFQNWRLWMEKGWLDAGMPMNYKREHCSSQASWYRNWIDAALDWRYQRHMYCGQGNYLNSMADSITQMQYIYTQKPDGSVADGSMNYSYYATRSTESICGDDNDKWVNDWGWYNYVSSNFFTSPVSPPAMPWRDPAIATEGTLWGQVINWDTGDFIDHATVQVGALDPVYTDGNGYYVVTLIPASASGTSYTIDITKSGLTSANHPEAVVLAGDIVRYDFSLGAWPPMIGVDPSLFDRRANLGTNLPNDTFTVTALASSIRGPVNYTISDDVNWLSVSPANGTSSGESDIITITYDTAGLALGSYTANITVSDAAADNNPQTIIVNLVVPTPGDFDFDGDVDQEDFGNFQKCFTGEAIPQNDPACQDAKFDGDGDVDNGDLELFLGCVSGPNIPADPNCLN